MDVMAVMAALITGTATVIAAFVASRRNRPRPSYFIPFAVVSAIALMVVIADLRDDGSDNSEDEASAADSVPTAVNPPETGGPTSTGAPDGSPSGGAGRRAECPSSHEFELVEARSEDFQIEDLPGPSEVIVQMTVQGKGNVVVVTLCEDSSGNPWYFSRLADRETTGIIAPAEVSDGGYETRVVFDDGPVTYVVAADGVDTDIEGVDLPLQHLICVDETVGVEGFDDLGDVGTCTDATIRPWTP